MILAYTDEPVIIWQAVIRVFIFILIAAIITHMSVLRNQLNELRIMNGYNRGLIEASLDPMLVIKADGRIMDINTAAERAIGYSRTYLIGTEFFNYFKNPVQVRNIYEDVFRARPRRNELLEIQHKDGKLTPVLYNASLYVDENEQVVGVFAAARDVTDRIKAENELKESEERYRSIFENAHEGIFRSTPEGTFITANQALADILGYESPQTTLKQVTNIALQHYVNTEDRNTFKEILKRQGFVKRYETQYYRKDRSIFWASLNAQIVYGKDGQIYYDGIVEDITNRKQKDEQIRGSLGATINAISLTLEMRDPYTAGHQRKVCDLACAIAQEMNLPSDQIDGIRIAASVHDLGKISVPAEILSKPSKLTEAEFSLMKNHPQAGYDILKDIDFPWPVAKIVLQHHERINRSGYPGKLKKEEILVESCIIAVADVVEAMASHRPYRPSLGIDVALSEIEKNKGIFYDNKVADACLKLFREKNYQL